MEVYTLVPRLCVDAVIIRDGGIVLSMRTIHPNKGLWQTPGGTVYKEESLEEAVRRVAKGEVGISLTDILRTGDIVETLDVHPDGSTIRCVSLVHLARGGLEPITGSEQGDIRVFNHLPPPEEMHPTLGPFLHQKWEKIRSNF
jgi:colanic acid biosynthesis protein WcaH